MTPYEESPLSKWMKSVMESINAALDKSRDGLFLQPSSTPSMWFNPSIPSIQALSGSSAPLPAPDITNWCRCSDCIRLRRAIYVGDHAAVVRANQRLRRSSRRN
jgi:hypothetical protein